MGDLAQFAWVVLQHWIAVLSGPFVAVVLFVIDKLTDWRLPKWAYVLVVAGGLLVASFKAWQAEHVKLTDALVKGAEAKARADQLQAKLDTKPKTVVTTAPPRQPAPPPQDPKAQYRKRLFLAASDLLRRIKPAELEWGEKKDAKHKEYMRELTSARSGTWQKLDEERKALEADGPLVPLGEIYAEVRKLMDELSIDAGLDVSAADRFLESPRKSNRQYTPTTVRALAHELTVLADKLEGKARN